MKKLLSFLTLTVFLFTSCSTDGDRGPQGPAGPQGPPGEAATGSIFETTVDFEPDDYSIIVQIPGNIEIDDTDIVQVYLLEFVDEETGNDVWSPLPQTFYLDEGEVVYNYNFTSSDVALFMDGNVDFGTLGTEYTQDQVFRIVVLPAETVANSALDVSDYYEVQQFLKVPEKEIPRIEIDK